MTEYNCRNINLSVIKLFLHPKSYYYPENFLTLHLKKGDKAYSPYQPF